MPGQTFIVINTRFWIKAVKKVLIWVRVPFSWKRMLCLSYVHKPVWVSWAGSSVCILYLTDNPHVLCVWPGPPRIKGNWSRSWSHEKEKTFLLLLFCFAYIHGMLIPIPFLPLFYWPQTFLLHFNYLFYPKTQLIHSLTHFLTYKYTLGL